jgi:hypothetical protein
MSEPATFPEPLPAFSTDIVRHSPDGNGQSSPILPGLVPQLTQAVVVNATANMDLYRNDQGWLVMDVSPKGNPSGLRRFEHLRRTEARGDVHCSFRVARQALLFAQGCLIFTHGASSDYLNCSL